jgi:hypothetical protein
MNRFHAEYKFCLTTYPVTADAEAQIITVVRPGNVIASNSGLAEIALPTPPNLTY